jgi:hypothetical protein
VGEFLRARGVAFPVRVLVVALAPHWGVLDFGPAGGGGDLPVG